MRGLFEVASIAPAGDTIVPFGISANAKENAAHHRGVSLRVCGHDRNSPWADEPGLWTEVRSRGAVPDGTTDTAGKPGKSRATGARAEQDHERMIEVVAPAIVHRVQHPEEIEQPPAPIALANEAAVFRGEEEARPAVCQRLNATSAAANRTAPIPRSASICGQSCASPAPLRNTLRITSM